MGGSLLGFLYIVFQYGQGFSVDHALNCPTGGIHNQLCDFTAEILSEVCADVCTEPPATALG